MRNYEAYESRGEWRTKVKRQSKLPWILLAIVTFLWLSGASLGGGLALAVVVFAVSAWLFSSIAVGIILALVVLFFGLFFGVFMMLLPILIPLLILWAIVSLFC